jgi:hypothetical protein
MESGQTYIEKRKHSGWNAKTYYDFDGDRKLSLHTSKRERGGISTFASVALHKDGFTTFALFYDYGKTVLRSGAKATEKAVAALHAEAQALLPQVIADAKAHYEAKGGYFGKEAADPAEQAVV